MKKIFLSVVALIAFAVGATAQTEATFNYLDKTYTLNEDGSTTLRVRSSLTYNTMSSFFSLFGETFIEYNPEFQKLTINECYTRQVDGTIITVPANAFNEVLPRHSADAPAYNHLTEMVVTHTGLELGATAFLDYTITTSADMLGGELDFTEVISQYAADVRNLSITVNLPKGKTLRYGVVDANGKCAGEKQLTGSYTWKWSKVKPYYNERYGSATYGKTRLYATTLENTAAVTGRIFYDTRDMFRIAPARVEGKQGEAKVKAICNYVGSMVDMKNIPFSLIGYRHAPARTVDARCYGSELDNIFMINKMLLGEGFNCDILLCYPADCPVFNLSGFTTAAVCADVEGKKMWIKGGGSIFTPSENADRQKWVSMVTMAPVEVEHIADTKHTKVEVCVNAEGKATVSADGVKQSDVKAKAMGGFNTLTLPSYGLNYAGLNTTRTEPFEVYNIIDRSEVYTVTLESGKFTTAPRKQSVANALGSASWEVAIDGNKATVKRAIKVNKTIVWPSEWKQLRELLVLNQNTAPLTLIYE